jgi:hypothetical protein
MFASFQSFLDGPVDVDSFYDFKKPLKEQFLLTDKQEDDIDMLTDTQRLREQMAR